MMKDVIIQKRNGSLIAFDESKIIKAIRKANAEVMESERVSDIEIRSIVNGFFDRFHGYELVSVEEVQDYIEDSLMTMNHFILAKKYILYRYAKSIKRNASNRDNAILDITRNANEEVAQENSNKDSRTASTQRDLIAGEISKDITMSTLLPSDVVKAHNDGVLHFHDADYFIQPIFNCCLLNIADMLDNGTCINGKLIETPKSFQVACTVTTQVIQSASSGQYGGQSVALAHLAKYIRVSREKYRRMLEGCGLIGEALEKSIDVFLKKELASGIQTITYQLNTLMTTNGQTPFITLFMQIIEGDEYEEEQAMLIEEVLRQRLEGIKNEKGVLVTPAFPKLIYVLDEHNCLKGGKYDYITHLAAKCSAKRMYPDYISAKKMREIHNGEVFSCMGCRSFLSEWKDEDGNYKWEGRFNQGVVSLNLPQIAIIAEGDEMTFWELLEERLALCRKALMCRHKALLGTPSDISPIHFQYGGIARLNKREPIDKLLKNGYSTISLGYIGLYETALLMTGESHTSEKGKEFALRLMNFLKSTCERWKTTTGLGFGLYGTPAESLCYRFARIDRERFGDIPNVTDKGYYTNSYHVDVREEIDAFSKLSFESEFQNISSGGAISYVEIPNMEKNIPALESMISFIYENIQYAEFNTRSDYCLSCGFEGEITTNKDGEWQCPQCGELRHDQLSIVRRTCGYIGSSLWNRGKTIEINKRRLHL